MEPIRRSVSINDNYFKFFAIALLFNVSYLGIHTIPFVSTPTYPLDNVLRAPVESSLRWSQIPKKSLKSRFSISGLQIPVYS